MPTPRLCRIGFLCWASDLVIAGGGRQVVGIITGPRGSEQLVGRLVSAPGDVGGSHAFQCSLFDGHVGVHVGIGRSHRLMSEPETRRQRDDTAAVADIDAKRLPAFTPSW
jgi:hypothetical protein